MKVILLEDVKSLGKKGDIVEVSTGYARNFILPGKKGVEATPGNLNDLKLQKANVVKKEQEAKKAAQELASRLEENPVEIKVRTGAQGKLFGAISSKEIAAAIKEQLKLDVDKKKIQLDEPIKELGTHLVKAKLHRDVAAQITVKVTEA